MSSGQLEISAESKRTGTRFGYGVAIVINLAMLVVVQNILEWGWLPFLTDEFATVVPWITLSLVLSIVVNLVYQINDSRAVKTAGQILVSVVSIFVTYQLLRVFPFDFSNYGFNWAPVVRIVLVLAMVGAGIGMLTEAVKLVTGEPKGERS